MTQSKWLAVISFLLVADLLHAQLSFSEVAAEAGINHRYLSPFEMGGGAAFFDMENDGDQDLWIAGGMNRDVLYENDGHGFFVEIGMTAGLAVTDSIWTTGVITGDFDNDGFRDVMLLTHDSYVNVLLRNNGDKSFTPLDSSAGLSADTTFTLAASIGDVNLDGYLDIYAANYVEQTKFVKGDSTEQVIGFDHTCYQNHLYLNNGDMTFTEVGESFGVLDYGCALATAFSDYDGDGDPDLVVANDFGEWVEPNALYENNFPEIGFTDVSAATNMDVGIYGMGIAIGDYDRDFDLDYYITNIGRNVLLQNDNSVFEDRTTEAGVEDILVNDSLLTVGWGTVLTDFDNDQDLDLFVVNGHVPSVEFIANDEQNPNRLFLNNGQSTFDPYTEADQVESDFYGRGLAAADIDLDGDVDFLVINVSTELDTGRVQTVQLFRNDLDSDNHWLQVELKGIVSNHDGFGSRISIYTKGSKQLHEYNGGFGTHASQHASTIHIGLGSEAVVDSLVIDWPSGRRQVETLVPTNQLVTITEDILISNTVENEEQMQINLRTNPNPFRTNTNIQYELKESSEVLVNISDINGRKIFNQKYSCLPGEHSISWEAPTLGIYIVKLRIGDLFAIRKIVSY